MTWVIKPALEFSLIIRKENNIDSPIYGIYLPIEKNGRTFICKADDGNKDWDGQSEFDNLDEALRQLRKEIPQAVLNRFQTELLLIRMGINDATGRPRNTH